MGDNDLETVSKEVFLSIPPAVRTGVFIDVFTPCDWHHDACCMVDYAGILDDPREPFAPACDMPVICTTAVTEKTVISDVRPLAYLPDDASVYRLVVDMEMDAVHRFAYRLSELTQRHLVLERSRTWKLAE